MQYILSDKTVGGCIFCQKSKEGDDATNLVVLRDRSCYALLNIYPYSNGHLMVAPYKHTSDFDALTEEELGDLMILTRRCQQLLRKTLRPEGFNVGVNLGKVAGAGIVEHLHIHVVPRWSGDVNFMTVTADTRIIPESLDDTWRKLREALEAQ